MCRWSMWRPKKWFRTSELSLVENYQKVEPKRKKKKVEPLTMFRKSNTYAFQMLITSDSNGINSSPPMPFVDICETNYPVF